MLYQLSREAIHWKQGQTTFMGHGFISCESPENISGFHFQLLNLEISQPSSFIYTIHNELFHIPHIISLVSGKNVIPQLTLLPMYGFIAQLVEHCRHWYCTGHGFLVEALNFFRHQSTCNLFILFTVFFFAFKLIEHLYILYITSTSLHYISLNFIHARACTCILIILNELPTHAHEKLIINK